MKASTVLLAFFSFVAASDISALKEDAVKAVEEFVSESRVFLGALDIVGYEKLDAIKSSLQNLQADIEEADGHKRVKIEGLRTEIEEATKLFTKKSGLKPFEAASEKAYRSIEAYNEAISGSARNETNEPRDGDFEGTDTDASF